ncbi:MAG: 4,5-DOPA dioxygenase extradiol [Chromatiales bacterium]|jgi:4,5-DOPA dioxygenase extradiol
MEYDALAAKSRDRMPVMFVGHGSPMNAIEDNRWSKGFAALRDDSPKPVAILAISAHWYVDGTYLTSNKQPPTIHDFGGFPEALYKVQYPAPGNPELAKSVQELIGRDQIKLSDDWGLDHGIWSVLVGMYPEADIPVVQLSIDRKLDVHGHFEIGLQLATLRKQNILIMASGNIVHNLPNAFRQMRTGRADIPDWAHRFDEAVRAAVVDHDIEALLALYPDTADARLAHPTPDHWLPLIYAVGATNESDSVRFSNEGFDWGSLSMRNIIFG